MELHHEGDCHLQRPDYWLTAALKLVLNFWPEVGLRGKVHLFGPEELLF